MEFSLDPIERVWLLADHGMVPSTNPRLPKDHLSTLHSPTDISSVHSLSNLTLPTTPQLTQHFIKNEIIGRVDWLL